MPSPPPTARECRSCGKSYPPEVYVCPICRNILVTPGTRAKTPGWIIGLLVAIIALLAIYAAVLAYQVLVLHRF